MPIILALVVALVSGLFTSAYAQEQKPIPRLDSGVHSNAFTDFFKDQQELWRSPLKVKRGDVKWLAPIGVGAAALLATDSKTSGAARRSESLRPPGRVLANFGGALPLTAASTSIWAIGKMGGNDKAANTGKMAAQAVLQTELLVAGIKMIAGRERPNKVGGSGEFRSGGQSFPSGHAATSFAFATVVAHQYKNKPLVVFGSYGLATAVSLSRVGGLNHFPSDVLIGATIGHLIGRFVLNRHD